MHDIIILEACVGTIAASGSLSGLTFVPLYRIRAGIKWRNLAASIVNPASFCIVNMIQD